MSWRKRHKIILEQKIEDWIAENYRHAKITKEDFPSRCGSLVAIGLLWALSIPRRPEQFESAGAIPGGGHAALAALPSSLQSAASPDMGAHEALRNIMAPAAPYLSPLVSRSFPRHYSKVRGVCGNPARTDLCGGRAQAESLPRHPVVFLKAKRAWSPGPFGRLARVNQAIDCQCVTNNHAPSEIVPGLRHEKISLVRDLILPAGVPILQLSRVGSREALRRPKGVSA